MTTLNIHLASMLFSLAVIFLADMEVFAWMRGKKQVLNSRRMRAYHLLVWAGLLSLVVSGTLLFLPMARDLLVQPLFVIKILFVAILLINAVLIGRLMHTASARPYALLSWQEKAPLLTSGVISTFSWACIVLIAFYLF